MTDVIFSDYETVYTAANLNAEIRDQTIVKCLSSNRPTSPTTGAQIFETDTGLKKLWNGTVWTEIGKFNGWASYTPTWGSVGGSAPTLGNGSLTGRYMRLFGRTFIVKLRLVVGSSTTFGSGGYFSFTAPSGVGANFVRDAMGKCYVKANTAIYGGQVIAPATWSVFVMRVFTGAAQSILSGVGPTIPETWVAANAGIIDFQITVEGASDS